MDVESNDPAAQEGEAGRISRRDALKKGAIGAGVVGVVWAAPAIEGLTLSPAYGAAASGGCHGNFHFDFKIPVPSSTPASTPFRSGCLATLTNSDVGGGEGGGIETITSTIVAGGAGCVFNAMNWDGKGFRSNADFADGDGFFHAQVHLAPTPGGPTISAQFVNDANQNGDLGAPLWGDTKGTGDGTTDADTTADGPVADADTGTVHFTVTCT